MEERNLAHYIRTSRPIVTIFERDTGSRGCHGWRSSSHSKISRRFRIGVLAGEGFISFRKVLKNRALD